MQKGNKGKKVKDDGFKASIQGGMIRASSGRFMLEMPVPRLPRWVGTPNLSADNSVYPRVNLDVPILPFGATITAGSMTQVINVDSSLVPNFATRFGATFKEFAIVGCRFEVRQVISANPQGVALVYFDEDSNAAPSSSALNYAHAELPIVTTSVDSTGSLHKVEWVAKSYADLTWDAIGTSGVVGYLKLYAGTATGTAASTTATYIVTGAFAICFRGYI